MSQALINRSHQAAPGCGTRRRHHLRSSLGSVEGGHTLLRSIGRAAMVHAHEVVLLASLAARAPLRLVGSSDQEFDTLPFRRAELATTARPVILVHGFGGAKSSWSHLARSLSARGVTFDAIAYSPFATSVEQVADRLVVEVGRMMSQTGADKVNLVGHSLGGVVIAHAIASGRITGQVDTIVTLGAPFGGSPWAHLLPFGAIVRELRGNSPLLRRLASARIPEDVRWLAVTATRDVIVPGRRSVPPHTNVETVTFRDVGHLGMLLSRQVIGHIIAALPA